MSTDLLPAPPADEALAARMANRLTGKVNTIIFMDFGCTLSSHGIVFEDPDKAALFMQLLCHARPVKSDGYGSDKKLLPSEPPPIVCYMLPDTCLQ